MTKSNRSATSGKVGKPHPDFPLGPHPSGQWCKKVRGRLEYFGRITGDENGQAALARWLREKDDLFAGRRPRSRSGDLILSDLCNQFLTSKHSDLDGKLLKPRTFAGYKCTTYLLIATFGRQRRVCDLHPTDFEALYGKLAKRHCVTTLGREVTMCRSVFKYAFESDLIDRPVQFGPKFRSPSKTEKLKAKAKTMHAHGARVFKAEEIRQLLESASPSLKAMILLGINAGLSNTDIAELPINAVDLENGWLDYPRPKTGIDRRIPLWPETVEAIRAVLTSRPKPRDKRLKHLVFLTRCGQPWVRFEIIESKESRGRSVASRSDDAIAKEMAKRLKAEGLYRAKVTSFSTLRHTTETIGGGARDQVAVDAVMGHVDPSMASEYREQLEDNRLIRVADHIHDWLFGVSMTQTKEPVVTSLGKSPASMFRIVG